MIETTLNELGEEMQSNIFRNYGTAIKSARVEGPTISEKWGWKVNRADRAAGGYHYMTCP